MTEQSNPVLAARRRLGAEIRAKFPPGRYWDNRALAKTALAIERNDPRIARYIAEQQERSS